MKNPYFYLVKEPDGAADCAGYDTYTTHSIIDDGDVRIRILLANPNVNQYFVGFDISHPSMSFFCRPGTTASPFVASTEQNAMLYALGRIKANMQERMTEKQKQVINDKILEHRQLQLF